MCGRYALTLSPDAVRRHFGYIEQPNFPSRSNIRPTEPVAVMHARDGMRHFALMRWGFIPSFVKDEREFPLLINARSETVFEKASFRNAIRRRRCLFLADAFYEWQKLDSSSRKKQPYLIRHPQGRPLAFAGIFENWMSPNGSEMETAAILTTSANALISAVHERMPVIIATRDFSAWLSPETAFNDVERLMRPLDDDGLELVEINKIGYE